MKYLVTGGAGFVGSHLSDALVSRGDSVVIVDDLSTGQIANIAQLSKHKSVELIQGSITDELLINRVMSRVDGCFHLAAAVGVNLIVEKPLESLTTNVRGSEVVLGAAEYFRVKTLVTSTSEIYGKNASSSMREDDDRILGSPLKVRWTYSEAKAIEEALAFTLWTKSGVPTIITRLFNTVGPRQTGSYGMVIPRFVDAALKGRDLQVFGNGQQSRVFCHVADAIDGLLMLWDNDKAIGDVFNIGGTEEVSMEMLAQRIIALTHSKSAITFVPYDQAYEPGFEDMQRRVPSTQKIEALTGWRAKRSLHQILEDVVEHQRRTGNK